MTFETHASQGFAHTSRLTDMEFFEFMEDADFDGTRACDKSVLIPEIIWSSGAHFYLLVNALRFPESMSRGKTSVNAASAISDSVSTSANGQ